MDTDFDGGGLKAEGGGEGEGRFGAVPIGQKNSGAMFRARSEQ